MGWGSDLYGAFYGDQDQAGLFGTGTFTPQYRQANVESFRDPSNGGWMNQAWHERQAVGARRTPTATAATLGSVANVAAPTVGYDAGTAATIDQGAANEARGYQIGLLGQLQKQAAGEGPSLATAQLKAGMDANVAAQMAMAGSQKGISSAGLGARTLAMQGSAAGQQVAQQGALLRMQEALNAQQQLGGLASGLRAQDLGVAGQQAALTQGMELSNIQQKNAANLAQAGFGMQAGLANQQWQNQFGLTQGQFDQQAALANQQAQLGMFGLEDAAASKYLGMAMGANENDRQAYMDYEHLMSDSYSRQQEAKARAYEGGRGKAMSMIGGIASLGMLSDERQKTDVQPGDTKLRAFLEEVGVHDYEYVDPNAPGAGEGRFVSPMAQELERTELGRAAVSEDEEGRKVVDYGKIAGAMLSASAMHERRLGRIEAFIGKHGG